MSMRHLMSGALAVAFLFAGRSVPASAQETTGRIEGTVIDARTRQPISGASVFIQNTGIGAQTNDRGRFVLVNVPLGRHEVRVRRIGFQTAGRAFDVTAGAVISAHFQINEAAVSLDEVVVTGTATTTRAKEVPTSTDIVSSAQFERLPVQNAQDVLAGRVPSLMIQANSGQPGAGGSVKIRGTNTITQAVEPLIYVDGIRIFNEIIQANYGSRTGLNPLQNINPEDIDRVEVVKGAAATTLYGTEASGGVIQIFTKKGLAGRPIWNLGVTGGANMSSRWGSKDDPTQLFVRCNDTANMYAIRPSTSTAPTNPREPFADPTCPADGNWTEPGALQQYDLSVRGGSPRVTYFLSGNFSDINGVLETQRSRSGGFRGNFVFSPIEQLQFQLNTAYNRRNTRSAGDGNNSEGFLLNVGRGPRAYMQGGKGDDCAGVPTGVVCVTNKYVFDQTLTDRTDNFLSGLTINFTPTQQLSNRFAVGWDYTDIQGITNLPFGFLTLEEGYFWDENTRHTKLTLDYAGSYQSGLPFIRSNVFVSKFSWGGQLFRDRHRWTEIDVHKFAGPGEPTLETGAEMRYRADRPTAVTNAGFFLQEELAWKDRLFVTAGVRIDGNSAFGDDFGLQEYPKLGFSYVLSEHGFWPRSWFETFKLRGAVGESGKAPGAFDKLRTWSPITGDENQPGFTPGDVGNPNLGPERTQEIEVGFDASFLNGRLGAEVTHFRARTLGAIVPVLQPPSNGFLESRSENVGELRNSGFELQLTGSLFRTAKFDWRARGNYSRLWSRAIDLGPRTSVGTSLNSAIRCEPLTDPVTGLALPECDRSKPAPFPAYYGRKVMNPNEIAAPKFEDEQFIGLVNPDEMWGVGTTLTFNNNLSLDAFVEHQGGFYVQNYTAYQNARRGVWFPCYDVQERTYRSYGPDRARNTSDDIPGELAGITALQRAQCAFAGHDVGFWTEPGDFTKLRYISLTYNLPGRFVNANTASVTLSARNLYTWTNYNGADPEVQDFSDQAGVGFGGTAGRFGRRDYYQIPQPRTYTFSLRVSF
jgi:TonB-linked SusC/RagA family outer membrane protein